MLTVSIIAAFLVNLSSATPVTISTLDGEIIDGTTTLESFEMEVIFGKATIRLREVDSVSFDAENDVVITVDGTVLRGRVLIEDLELTTAIGKKVIARDDLQELIVHRRPSDRVSAGPEVAVDIATQDGKNLRGMMRPTRFIFLTSFGRTTLRMQEVEEITVGSGSEDVVVTRDKTVLRGRIHFGLVRLRTDGGVVTLRRDAIRRISARDTK